MAMVNRYLLERVMFQFANSIFAIEATYEGFLNWEYPNSWMVKKKEDI